MLRNIFVTTIQEEDGLQTVLESLKVTCMEWYCEESEATIAQFLLLMAEHATDTNNLPSSNLHKSKWKINIQGASSVVRCDLAWNVDKRDGFTKWVSDRDISVIPLHPPFHWPERRRRWHHRMELSQLLSWQGGQWCLEVRAIQGGQKLQVELWIYWPCTNRQDIWALVDGGGGARYF